MGKVILAFCAFLTWTGVSRAADTVITNVSVVDVEAGKVRSGQTVVIVGTQIEYVGGKSPAARAGATIVDARGKYILPGFWDMGNFALDGTRGVPKAMELMVAHGVVGFRDLGTAGTPAQIKALVGEIESGRRVGPKLIWASQALSKAFSSSAPRVGPSRRDIQSEAEAVGAVNGIADSGAHYIKLHQNFPENWLPSVVRTARARKLPVMGAVVSSWKQAAETGVSGFDHFVDLYRSTARRPKRDQFLSLYRDDRFRRDYDDKDKMYAFILPLRRLRDEQYYRSTVAALAKARAPVTTNMATMFWAQVGREGVISERGKFAYPNRPREVASPGTTDDKARDGLFGDLRDLRDAGVPIMTGTQAEGAGHELPGATLQDEIILLTRAGFTPREALAAATVTPAAVIGRLFPRVHASGKVVAGMPADLVLLDDNPLADITNVRKVWATVADGRWIGPEQRAKLLADAVSAASLPPPADPGK